jgi:hypothetical protein
MRLWQAFQVWRDGIAEKRRLDVRETFRRLPLWARCALILCWIVTLWKFFAPVIALNVAPHFAHAIGPDWSIDWNEWQVAETQLAGIIALAVVGLLLALPQIPFVMKPVIIVAAIFGYGMNLQNGTATQSHSHDVRTRTAQARNDRIAVLNRQVADNTIAHKNVAPHAYADDAMVAGRRLRWCNGPGLRAKAS